MSLIRRLAPAVALAVAVPCVGSAQALAIAPGLALATFDSAWTRIDRTFFDTTFLNTRWKVLRDSLRPIAEHAETNEQLRRVLRTLLSNITASHFGLIPREVAPAINAMNSLGSGSTGAASSGGARGLAPGATLGNAGTSLRLADDRLVVWKVDSGGPAWRAGVRPGMEVISIDGVETAEALLQLARIDNEQVKRQTRLTFTMRANAQLSGAVGDPVTLQLASGATTRTYEIARGPVRGGMTRFGNLPPINTWVESREVIVQTASGPKRIGIIGFSAWLPVLSAEIDRAFDEHRDADGIVLDLRGNPGGLAGMTNGVAGHMLDSALVLGTLQLRTTTMTLRANPRLVSPAGERVEPFDGPVAVVLDPLSASATEFFTAGLQGLGRVRVFGEPSAGASLPAVMGRLPNGDVMMHAIADHVDSQGRRIEGRGVIPDVLIPLKAAALAAGRDEAMDAAIRWAASRSTRIQ